MKNVIWFIVGLGLGIGLAILIGWVWFPVEIYNTAPDVLRPDYQDEYIRLISVSYQVDGDLTRAQERLGALDNDDPTLPLVELTERWITQERSEKLIMPLIRLARALDVETTVMQQYVARGAP